MKVFKDLEFKKRDNFISIQATMGFGNGYKLSVVAGPSAYCSPREDNTDPDFFESFEVGVFNSDKELTREFFPDHLDDVLGWQDRGQINALMLLIQSK